MGFDIPFCRGNSEVEYMNLTYSAGLRNITEPSGVIYALNDASGGILGIAFLFVVWIILLLVLINNNNDLKISFASSTFVGLVLAWIMWIANILSAKWMYLFLIMLLIAIAGPFMRD